MVGGESVLMHPRELFRWSVVRMLAAWVGIGATILMIDVLENGSITTRPWELCALVMVPPLAFSIASALAQWVLLRRVRQELKDSCEQFVNFSESSFLGLLTKVYWYSHFFDGCVFLSVKEPSGVRAEARKVDFDEGELLATFTVGGEQSTHEFVLLDRQWNVALRRRVIEPEEVEVFGFRDGAVLVFSKRVDEYEAIPFCRLMPTVEAAMTEAAKFGTRVESDQ